MTELCLQVFRERRGLPEPGAGKEGLSPEASVGTTPCQRLVFRLLTSRTVGELMCIALSHLGCDTGLWHP